MLKYRKLNQEVELHQRQDHTRSNSLTEFHPDELESGHTGKYFTADKQILFPCTNPATT